MTSRLLALLGFPLFAACGGPAETESPPAADTVVRPSRIDALDVAVQTHALPDGLRDDATLSIAALDGGVTLIGGAAGLYTLDGTGFREVAGGAVTGLAVTEEGTVVGRSDGLHIYDGDLTLSPLSERLGGGVTAVALRGTELFLGTDEALFLLADGGLYAFDELGAVRQIAASADNRTLIVDRDDETLRLKEEDGVWSRHALTSEVALDAVVPAGPDRIFAAAVGLLVERVSLEDGAAWRPVALTAEKEDTGASGIEAISVEPASGRLWVVTRDSVARLYGDAVALRERPPGLGAALAARATRDGAVWISDGTNLVRVGSDQPPVTWSDDVRAFSADNCERCHIPLGVGHPLDTYEAWTAEVDRIIDALEQERMPQDGAVLVGGTADLIRRWKADGLLP